MVSCVCMLPVFLVRYAQIVHTGMYCLYFHECIHVCVYVCVSMCGCVCVFVCMCVCAMLGPHFHAQSYVFSFSQCVVSIYVMATYIMLCSCDHSSPACLKC